MMPFLLMSLKLPMVQMLNFGDADILCRFWSTFLIVLRKNIT